MLNKGKTAGAEPWRRSRKRAPRRAHVPPTPIRSPPDHTPHARPPGSNSNGVHIPSVAKIPKHPLTLGLWISRRVHRVMTALWVNTCSHWDAVKDNQTTQLGRNISPGQGFPFQKIAELYKPWASLVAQRVKNLPTMWETWVRSPAWEDPVEKG